MPTVMFGLPAVGIAIYFSNIKEKCKMVKSVIVAGIVASGIGGFTETLVFFNHSSNTIQVFLRGMLKLGYIKLCTVLSCSNVYHFDAQNRYIIYYIDT